MPICALAEAIWRSASAISGRRSRRSEGSPALNEGRLAFKFASERDGNRARRD